MLEYLPTIVAVLGVMLTAWGTLRVTESRVRDLRESQKSLWDQFDGHKQHCEQTKVSSLLFAEAMKEIRRRLESIERKIDKQNGRR